MPDTPRLALIASIAFAGVGLAIAAPDPAAAGACDRTTELAHDACLRQADATHVLALGVCSDLAGSEARKTCEKRADRTFADAPATCKAQRQARTDVCGALGQAAYDPRIRPSDFVAKIDNPYFPLKPGKTLVYKGKDSKVVFDVTKATVKILGVTCVVVHDTAYEGGEVVEDTFDYFAQDKKGNVWYFGEATGELVDGAVVSNHGAWVAGVNGAKPGIIMPASPEVGQTVRVEFALGTAEDLARTDSLKEHVEVPFGSFDKVLRTRETTPLEPGLKEDKYYARGIGVVLVVDRATGEREELVDVK